MYLKWSEQTTTDFSDINLNTLYNQGWLFGRTKMGYLYQTRSLRVDLNKFELLSENRRILRKNEDVKLTAYPLPYEKYSWEIGKLGKDFYSTKFGDGTFSANKIKELLTTKNSNFNRVFVYSTHDNPTGYAICLETNEFLHYSYPFYDLKTGLPNLGLGMMTKAIHWAKERHKKYLYLGSVKDKTALYKIQFSGLEWWNGKSWNQDLNELTSA